jgi:hypothetical protein
MITIVLNTRSLNYTFKNQFLKSRWDKENVVEVETLNSIEDLLNYVKATIISEGDFILKISKSRLYKADKDYSFKDAKIDFIINNEN